MGSIPRDATGIYRQRGKLTYWLRWTPVPGGKQHRTSLRTRDYATAVQRAKAVRNGLGPQLRTEVGSSLSEIERYLEAKKRDGCTRATLSSRGYVLKAFVKALGADEPGCIRHDAVTQWFRKRLEKSPHTAIAYLNQVRWWLAWLREEGRLRDDPTRGIKTPKVKPRCRRAFLTPAEARRLIDATDGDWNMRFAVLCALHAGLRKLEVIEARASWFDLERGLLHVDVTPTFVPKDRDARTIPLTAEFKAFLNAQPLPYPFPFHPEARHGKAPYRFDLRKSFERLLIQADVRCTFHDLRRTFASLLVSKGVSIYKVARWLGDELETVQDHYGHLIPQDDQINASWL